MASSQARIVFVTAGTQDSAAAIARTLVAESLAACVNLLPIRSIYRWKEKIEDEPEYLLIIKTRRARFRTLERRLRELHTYEVPEVISIPIDAGAAPYLNWLMRSTAKGPAATPKKGTQDVTKRRREKTGSWR